MCVSGGAGGVRLRRWLSTGVMITAIAAHEIAKSAISHVAHVASRSSVLKLLSNLVPSSFELVWVVFDMDLCIQSGRVLCNIAYPSLKDEKVFILSDMCSELLPCSVRK